MDNSPVSVYTACLLVSNDNALDWSAISARVSGTTTPAAYSPLRAAAARSSHACQLAPAGSQRAARAAATASPAPVAHNTVAAPRPWMSAREAEPIAASGAPAVCRGVVVPSDQTAAADPTALPRPRPIRSTANPCQLSDHYGVTTSRGSP
eukprot:9470821-Pyramimonas_sp.AAC.2